jgi:hypothetical protein
LLDRNGEGEARMAIDLADYEKGEKLKGDYEAQLEELQLRLAKIQVAHVIHDRRSVILRPARAASSSG